MKEVLELFKQPDQNLSTIQTLHTIWFLLQKTLASEIGNLIPKRWQIEHDLYIDSTDFVGKDLIRQKLAVKSSDGNYYERIEDKTLKIEKEEMLIDNRGLIDVYRKVKK